MDRLDFPPSPEPEPEDEGSYYGDDMQVDAPCIPDSGQDEGEGAGEGEEEDDNSENQNNDSHNTDREDDAAEYEVAVKVVQSKGKPKASDYEQRVQDVLGAAITLYRVDLLKVNCFPDHQTEISLAKYAWSRANVLNKLRIMYNSELLKMVCCL